MEVQSYISQSDTEFDTLKHQLKQAPLHLEVRERDDLFALMFSDASPKDSSLIRQCVGPIFDKASKTLCSYSLDLAHEILINQENPDWTDLNNMNLNSTKVTEYVEGIKLTVFFHKKWRIRTTRVIDAYHGYWCSPKSFATMFMETCKVLFPEIHAQIEGAHPEGPLSTQCSYVFVLSHPEHHCLQEILNPSLIHIATFDLQSFKYVSQDIGVPKQAYLKFSSVDALKENLQNSSTHHPGYILEGTDDAKWSRTRLVTLAYKRLQELRGNDPDLYRHYLNVRQSSNETLEQLIRLIPRFRAIQWYVESQIHELARAIHDLYIAFFVKRYARPHLDKTLFVTLMQLHNDYRASHVKRNRAIVYDHVSSLPAALLHRLLTNTRYGTYGDEPQGAYE